jgi:hypothetical protein
MKTGVRIGIGNCIGSLYRHTTMLEKMKQIMEHLVAAIGGLKAVMHNNKAKKGLK